MRERLVELIGAKICEDYSPTCNEWQPHSCEKCYANNCRIGDLADYLIENGVVVPLLQTGQIVYRVSKGRMWEVKIWKIEICGKTISYIDNYDKSFLFNHIGKGVFRLREEAERALKGGAE